MLKHEIEAIEQSTDKSNIKKLNMWIDTSETKILTKLQHAESQLEKYQTQSREMDATDEASEKVLEKIHSCEDKIATCQELLKVINQLRTKLADKTQNLS